MAHHIPKIEYGTVIPTVIVFDYHPEGMGDPEQYKTAANKSTSLSGVEQVSVNYTEVTRKLNFSHLTETLNAAMKVFFRTHARYGKSFKYFEDQDGVDYTTYTLDNLEYLPRKIAIAGENLFFYKLPLTFRRVDGEEIANYMEATIADNQTVAADVIGLELDPTLYRTVKIFCEIIRSTDSVEIVTNGFLTAVYKEGTSSWEITEIGTFDGTADHGVRFSMDGNQVQYTSSDLAGLNYEGVIRVKNFTITSG